MYMLIVVEKSKLSLNNPLRASLKTTIPIFVVKTLGVTKDDSLSWEYREIEGKKGFFVTKAEE